MAPVLAPHRGRHRRHHRAVTTIVVWRAVAPSRRRWRGARRRGHARSRGHGRDAVRDPGRRRRTPDLDHAGALGRVAAPGTGRGHLGAAAGRRAIGWYSARVAAPRRRSTSRMPCRRPTGQHRDAAPLALPRADAQRTQRVSAYVALTKPRIIELLLVTTVPAMVLAWRYGRRLDPLAVHLAGDRHAHRRLARGRRRQRHQQLPRPRHRPDHGPHPAPARCRRTPSRPRTRSCSGSR